MLRFAKVKLVIKVNTLFIIGFMAIFSCSLAQAKQSGILLKGSPNSPAVSVLTHYIASRTPEELEVAKLRGNEYYCRILEAVISEKALVAEVNRALKEVHAMLAYSSEGNGAVTLTLSQSMDLDGLRKIAKKLTASGAFIAAGPSFLDGPAASEKNSTQKAIPLSKPTAPAGHSQQLQKSTSKDRPK
jgi:hypothetical protein